MASACVSSLCAPRQRLYIDSFDRHRPIDFEDRRIRPRRPKTFLMNGRSSKKGNESGHGPGIDFVVRPRLATVTAVAFARGRPMVMSPRRETPRVGSLPETKLARPTFHRAMSHP